MVDDLLSRITSGAAAAAPLSHSQLLVLAQELLRVRDACEAQAAVAKRARGDADAAVESAADLEAELSAIQGAYAGVREEREAMAEEMRALERQYLQLLQDAVCAAARLRDDAPTDGCASSPRCCHLPAAPRCYELTCLQGGPRSVLCAQPSRGSASPAAAPRRRPLSGALRQVRGSAGE